MIWSRAGGRVVAGSNPVWRKRSIPTHLERHNPPTIIAKMGLKRA